MFTDLSFLTLAAAGDRHTCSNLVLATQIRNFPSSDAVSIVLLELKRSPCCLATPFGVPGVTVKRIPQGNASPRMRHPSSPFTRALGIELVRIGSISSAV